MTTQSVRLQSILVPLDGRVGLMVVATHGLGGLRRMVLGSVADKVVRGANVPVLVVRPTGRRARRKSGEVNVAIGAGAPS